MKKYTQIFIILTLLFASCRKDDTDHLGQFHGEYGVAVSGSNWTPGNGTSSSTSSQRLIVNHHKNGPIQIEDKATFDNMDKEETGTVTVGSFIYTLRFWEDSIYLRRQTYSGGGGSSTTYIGRRLE